MKESICCEEKCTACMACANACPKGAICEKMPKLEADARYQLLSSCYFLVRQMDNQKVRKDYPSEYRMIKNEIHDLRIDDILNIISPQRRKGIMLIKYAPWLYSLLKG